MGTSCASVFCACLSTIRERRGRGAEGGQWGLLIADVLRRIWGDDKVVVALCATKRSQRWTMAIMQTAHVLCTSSVDNGAYITGIKVLFEVTAECVVSRGHRFRCSESHNSVPQTIPSPTWGFCLSCLSVSRTNTHTHTHRLAHCTHTHTQMHTPTHTHTHTHTHMHAHTCTHTS